MSKHIPPIPALPGDLPPMGREESRRARERISRAPRAEQCDTCHPRPPADPDADCSGCGKHDSTLIGKLDAAGIEHAFHPRCWTDHLAWLKRQPISDDPDAAGCGRSVLP